MTGKIKGHAIQIERLRVVQHAVAWSIPPGMRERDEDRPDPAGNRAARRAAAKRKGRRG